MKVLQNILPPYLPFFRSLSVRTLGFLTLALVLSGCANLKQLRLHKERIDALAYGNLSPQEKFDGLGEELVILLDVSLSRPSAIGTYKHVDKFTRQNEAALEKLVADLGAWQADMSGPQKVAFGTRVATKSYTRRFITLMPKFKKKVGNKYDQLVFFAKLMNLFNPLKKNDR